MAPSSVVVRCSGAVFSSLLYEQLRVARPQEGFLLGQVDDHVSQHISDLQICNEKTQTVITLSSFLPCTRLGTFYSGAGTLDAAHLTKYLGDNYKRVVGWYRCRGGGKGRVYVREALVHTQLSQLLTHTAGCFVLALLASHPPSAPLAASSGTLEMAHKLFMLQNGRLEGVALEVVNVGDTSTHSYLITPHHPALTHSPVIQGVLRGLARGEPGVAEMGGLHSGLQGELRALLPRLAEAQCRQAAAARQVEELRALCHAAGIVMDFCPEDGEEGGKEDRRKEGRKEQGRKEEGKEKGRKEAERRGKEREREPDLMEFEEEEEKEEEKKKKEEDEKEEDDEVEVLEVDDDVMEVVGDEAYPPSSSSSTSSNTARRGGGGVRGRGRRSRRGVGGRGRAGGGGDDPFGFINTEMEKLQDGRTRSSPSRSPPSRSSPRGRLRRQDTPLAPLTPGRRRGGRGGVVPLNFSPSRLSRSQSPKTLSPSSSPSSSSPVSSSKLGRGRGGRGREGERGGR